MHRTLDSLILIAMKYKTRTAFRVNATAYYHAARRKKVLKEVCSHMPKRACKHTLQELISEAEKYSTKYQFCQQSNTHYQSALRQDIIDVVCSHMSPDYEPQVIATSVKPVNPPKTSQAQKVRAHAMCI